MRYSYCAIEKLWIHLEPSPTTKPYFFVHPTNEPLVQMSGNSTRFFLLNQKKKKKTSGNFCQGALKVNV